jgi:putative cell wall-binding protein
LALLGLALATTAGVLMASVGVSAAAQGSWSKTKEGPIPVRSFHGAVRLDDRVLVMGGDPSESSSDKVELYDPGQDKWIPEESMNHPRKVDRHRVTKLADGRVLVGPGSSNNPNLEIYDPKATEGRWSEVTPPFRVETLERLHGPECDQLPHPAWCDTVLATGGASGFDQSGGAAAIFDPSAADGQKWTVTDAPTQMMKALVSLDGRPCEQVSPPEWCGTVLGVRPEAGVTEVYDPRASDGQLPGQWKAAEDLNTARLSSTVTFTPLGNGDVLLAGGSDADQGYPYPAVATAELYRPKPDSAPNDGQWSPTGGWDESAKLDQPRTGHEAAFVPDVDGDGRGMVLIAGGEKAEDADSTCGLASAELFDPSADDGTGAFVAAPPMSVGRRAHTATTLADGRVLAVGGRSSACGKGSAEIYDPSPQAPPPDVEWVTPDGQVTSGGGRVSISGTGLWGATSVTFGGVPAEEFTVKDHGLIEAVAPPHEPGTVPVQVTTEGGTSPEDDVKAAFTYVKASGAWTEVDRLAHTPAGSGVRGAPMAGGALAVYEDVDGEARVEGYRVATDAFEPVASPPGRVDPTVTAPLDSGGVLVAGDVGAAVYDPEGEAWQSTGPPVFPIDSSPDISSATPLADGRVLVLSEAEGTPTSQVYDPASDSWRRTQQQPDYPGFSGSSVTRLSDGRVLVAGPGYVAAAFEPDGEQWTLLPEMGNNRAHHVGARLSEGRALLAGGNTRGREQSGAEVFDPNGVDCAASWCPQQPMISRRSYHTQTRLANGSVLAAGGGALSAEVFDPATGRWQPAALMHRRRKVHAAVALDTGCGSRCGNVLAIGGGTVGGPIEATASVERYVPRPQITDVSPASGIAGSEVTISGFGLSGVDEVTIGGQAVDFSVAAHASGPKSPGKITASVPLGLAAGQVPVAASTTVDTKDGAATLASLESSTFTVVEPTSGDGGPDDGSDKDDGDGPTDATDDGPEGDTTQDEDGVSPSPGAVGRVEGLTARAVSETEIELAWSAVADGIGGAADEYVVAQARSPIDDPSDFDTALTLCGGVCDDFNPPPQAVGASMGLNVSDLTPGSTYHYAIAALDADGQRGPISASASATTTGTPPDSDQGGATDDTAPAAAGGVARIAGPSRMTTALAASQEAFGEGEAPAAVLARAGEFADALAGVPLAQAEGAPLLLTPSGELDGRVAGELQRAVADGGRVYLLGGTAALSQQIAQQVTELGFEVVRLGGATRFETAATIAEDGLGAPDRVLVTTGSTFADAVAAGAAAAHTDAAVLLTAGETLPAATADYLTRHPPTSQHAIGGPAAAAAPQIPALVGATRYETAATVADEFFSEPATVGMATGTAFPDSLTGGAHIAAYGGPMLLSAPDGLHPAAADYLAARPSVATTVLYGGSAALAETVADDATAELTEASQ